MSSEAFVANAIGEMVDYFLPHCDDTKTLVELKTMASDRTRWRLGHGLFDRIRNKMLKADRKSDLRLQHQYLFEEICAKTLFNLCGSPAPFDDDSPFWVIPIALQFAAYLRLDDPYSMTPLLQPQSDG